MPNVKKKRVTTTYMITLLLVAMVTIGVVAAIMAKNVESRANNFSFSTINVTVEEPSWGSEEKIVYPGKVHSKDPYVQNQSANSLYMYLEVKVPVAETVKIAETVAQNSTDEKIVEEINYELFDYDYDVNDEHWKLINDKALNIGGLSEDGKYMVYVYVYDQEVLPLGRTTSLFNNVTFRENILECQPETGLELWMPVSAYAIQPEYLMTFDQNDEDAKLEVLKKAFKSTYLISGLDADAGEDEAEPEED